MNTLILVVATETERKIVGREREREPGESWHKAWRGKLIYYYWYFFFFLMWNYENDLILGVYMCIIV